jgi:MoaA/NifB/PqqE/SkfB family radical SAM enzyme
MSTKTVFNRDYLENLPYSMLRLGKQCNAACLFCNIPSDCGFVEEMKLLEIKRMIDRLAKTQKYFRLDISGGEPTLYKNLAVIVNYAKTKGAVTVEIQTNGILLSDRKYVQSLKKSGLSIFFVGLHASHAAIHDRLVGVNGAFDKCIRGIKNALNVGLEVVLNPVLTRYNYKNAPQYIKFIKNNFPDIRFISLSVVQPRGRAQNNREIVPRYKDISTSIQTTLRLASRYGIILNNPYCGVPFCIGGWHNVLTQCVEYCEQQLMVRKIDSIETNKDKIKGIQCGFCELKNSCGGVWKEYAAMYPMTDLMPVRKKNGKFSLYSSYKKV